MDIMRLEYDFRKNEILSKTLNEIINLGTQSIEEKLNTGRDSNIILSDDYILQTKFYSKQKEQGIAINYKNSFILNIYPTTVCITVSFKDLEVMEMQTLKQVEENLKSEISLHIKNIFKLIISLRKGVEQNEE